jgi:hypothetical protein
VDIGGHPPIPTDSKQFSDNLLFLVVFRFLNFRGHFEGLNEGFLGSKRLDDYQSYAPGKLIHQTTQNGVHKIVGFSSFGVRVWNFLYDKKAFGASL